MPIKLLYGSSSNNLSCSRIIAVPLSGNLFFSIHWQIGGLFDGMFYDLLLTQEIANFTVGISYRTAALKIARWALKSTGPEGCVNQKFTVFTSCFRCCG